MATLTKYRGRWSVKIRRKGHRGIYETFDKISDARSFINKVESEIQQKKFKDISEANNTSLRVVLHRYIREKLQHKQDKKRERSKFNVILRHDIVKIMLGELRTSDFAKYRDQRLELGITNSTVNFQVLMCDKVFFFFYFLRQILNKINYYIPGMFPYNDTENDWISRA